MSARAAYERALVKARADRPADCTCDGMHTDYVEPALLVMLPSIIEAERSWGCCPAEIRALQRIATRL